MDSSIETAFHDVSYHVLKISNCFPLRHAGLFYKDFKVGEGSEPVDGQQVTFAYTAYNESGGLIDSTYRQGRNAETQLGIGGLIPGAFLSRVGEF
jgi:FKBP-type peptidyl-prolyl cis-trans isomerase